MVRPDAAPSALAALFRLAMTLLAGLMPLRRNSRGASRARLD
jgi:hypothetical protein